MTARQIKEALAELDPEALLAAGFDEALIGIVRQFSRYLALYDTDKVLAILASRMELSDDEERLPLEIAEEYFEYNVVGAWVGEHTPVFTLPTQFKE